MAIIGVIECPAMLTVFVLFSHYLTPFRGCYHAGIAITVIQSGAGVLVEPEVHVFTYKSFIGIIFPY